MFAAVLFNIIFAISEWHWNLYFRNKFLYRISFPLWIVDGYGWGHNPETHASYRTLYFFGDRLYMACEGNKVKVELWGDFYIPFFTNWARYVDYALWQSPCETGERPSTWEVFKYSMKNYYHYEIYMYLVGKWALLEKRVKEYFLTLYYTYAFRLLLRLHADPNMEKIINAYLDNEKVIVPAGPDGLFTLDQVIAVHKWNEAVTRPDFLPVRDIENEHIWKCEICQERESYFQAMSLNEMGEFMPDWATAILAQYEDKDLPVCPNATNTK